MTLPTRPCPGSRSLLRVLAAYVAAIVLVQAFAAAFALGAGHLHHHRDTPSRPDTRPALAALTFAHHGHAHALGERHHHDADDTTVVHEASAPEALDRATQALGSALTLLAVDSLRLPPDHAMARTHVLREAPTWAWCPTHPAGLYRPPRQG